MQSKVHGSVDNEKRPVPTPQDVANFSDRKSTRLNSSHSQISYAVFCLKKKICQVSSSALAAWRTTAKGKAKAIGWPTSTQSSLLSNFSAITSENVLF